jgi:pyruvate,water dikinase
MKYFFFTDNKLPPSVALLGGKGFHLHWLRQEGFNVPAFFVFTTRGFDAWTAKVLGAGAIERLGTASGKDKILEIAAEIHSAFTSRDLPDDLARELDHYLGQGVFAKEKFFAVRSSAVDEDSHEHSFAGQMESFLFQRTREDIRESLAHCVASAFSERAILYRIQHKIPLATIQAAAIVQVMIEGEKSGVFFTAHPISGKRNQGLITSCYGIGEGIVSGVCNTDEISVGMEDSIVHTVVNLKDRQMVFDTAKGRGVIEVDVPPEQQNVSSLTSRDIDILRDIGKRISGKLRSPQDIEWTWRNGEFFVLQTRPITSLPVDRKNPFNEIVWDNSNIQESYCGVTTPLTFSYAARAYHAVYREILRVLKVPEETIKEYEPVLRNMLGLIRGRVYYNINNWYACLLLLPSFEVNKEDMERMMGLEDPVDFVYGTQATLWEKVLKLPKVTSSLLSLLANFRKITQRTEEFETSFDEIYHSVDRSSLHRKSTTELIKMTFDLYDRFFNNWQAPIINDFLVMMMNGKTFRRIAKLELAEGEGILNYLLAGEEGIESTEPTKFLLRICDRIRQSSDLAALCKETPPEMIGSLLRARDSSLYEMCFDYIDLYGDRCMGELKLESTTLREDPTFMYAIIKNYLVKPDLTEKSLVEKEKKLRSEAEAKVFSAMREKFGAAALTKFKKELGTLRFAIKNRERMRMARTRMFGLFRSIFLEIGKQLQFYGQIDDTRDIFYITTEEMETFVEGRAIQTDLRAVAKERKREYAEYEREDLPHHFITRGLAYFDNEYVYPYDKAITEATDGAKFKGTGCYPGIVKGTVKVIFDPSDGLDLQGQILSTVRTDPGWAPLFPSVSGLLIERGSTLSHSAVVARELGIPAIVGIPNITKLLKSGDEVVMDGERGEVEILTGKL